MIQVLPSDYYAQLEVAHHISCYAFSSKVWVAGFSNVASCMISVDLRVNLSAGQSNGG